MKLETEFIAASCNCTYNCLELTDSFILFGANHALAAFSFEGKKIVKTQVFHTGRINCVRFVKNSQQKCLLTCGADGSIVLWNYTDNGQQVDGTLANPTLTPYLVNKEEFNVMICDGIQKSKSEAIIGYITTRSKIELYNACLEGPSFSLTQTIDLKNSVALDLAFHKLSSSQIILGIGRDSGAVALYDEQENKNFHEFCVLRKHEDWVRCLAFCEIGNGETLLASGGQDSFIAVWRFTETDKIQNRQAFEFQSHKFQNYTVIFDSMIIGHEGWICSLDFSNEGKLLSCSSDQSIIVWSNGGDIWAEEARLGSMGGEVPGGFGAKLNDVTIVSWGFQGAIQVWNNENDAWSIQPSITGHFGAITDMDYHPEGHFIVTTSRDQTTRVFAPWGPNSWHEISRLQIHGHDLFAVKCCGDFVVSGAEEKILRAFQPTQRFIQSLEDISSISVNFKNAAAGATLPALGLSNQSSTSIPSDQTIESLLDDDFLRSQTLWPEVSKCYGHVYEISCIATSTALNLVASASQSTKPQFAAIILWDATTWTKLGDFPFHKLNVTDMEFTTDGSKLLSVSRDRTWAVWEILKSETNSFTMKLLSSDGSHTRALWVGTWKPGNEYFATGARDKKLILWKLNENGDQPHARVATQSFESSVSAASINEEDFIAVGLESGHLIILKYDNSAVEAKRLEVLVKLDTSFAHHDTIERLRFNPKQKYQLASCGADRLVKIFQLLH